MACSHKMIWRKDAEQEFGVETVAEWFKPENRGKRFLVKRGDGLVEAKAIHKNISGQGEWVASDRVFLYPVTS